MPFYIYAHPKTKEMVEVFQHMNDEHVYVDKNGLKWNRVFTNPCAAVDSRLDAMDAKAFARKMGQKRTTLGEVFDSAKEASEKRTKIMGRDEVKEEYYKNYSKKRKGRPHPHLTKDPEIHITL